MKVIIHKHYLDRSPTQEDRRNKVGLDDFIEKLEVAGWITGKDGTVIKSFDYAYHGHVEPGNHYIEWKAVLRSYN